MVPVVSSAEMLTDVNGIVLHLKLLAISAPLLASVSLDCEENSVLPCNCTLSAVSFWST